MEGKMINWKKIFKPVLILLLISFLIPLGSHWQHAQAASSEKVFKLRFTTIHPPIDPMNSVVNESWIRWLERESGGRLKVTLYPSASLAAPPDTYDAARTGLVDIGEHCAITTPGRFSISEVVTLPMVVKHPGSRATSLALMDLYKKYPAIQAEYPDVKVLVFHGAGCSQLLSIDKPIRTLDDWKGKNVISMGGYGAKFVSALGGTPVSMDMTEYYDALAKKVVDGHMCNWQAVQIHKYNEVVKYATECGIMMDTFFVQVMNMKTWNSLPPDLQALFIGENAWRMANINGYIFDKADVAAKDIFNQQLKERNLPEIYTLPEDERAKWEAKAQKVREEWIKDSESKGAPAADILKDAIMLAEKYNYSTTPFDGIEKTLHDWGAAGY